MAAPEKADKGPPIHLARPSSGHMFSTTCLDKIPPQVISLVILLPSVLRQGPLAFLPFLPSLGLCPADGRVEATCDDRMSFPAHVLLLPDASTSSVRDMAGHKKMCCIN